MATGDTNASTFAERFRDLLHESGMSLRGLARQISFDPGYLSDVKNGHRPPSRAVADAVDEALHAHGELVALCPPPRTRRSQPDDSAVTVDQSPTPNQGDDDVKRRAALQILTAISAGAAVPPGAVESVLAGVENAAGTDRLDLAEWERIVADYDHRIHRSPAGFLVEDLTADIIALDVIFKRRLSPLQQAGLLRVSAALTGLLAIDLGDAGDHRASRVAWGTATRAADASGDRTAQTWVRGRAAEDGVFTGRAPQVVSELAKDAIGIADGAPSPGLARAHAALLDLAALRGA